MNFSDLEALIDTMPQRGIPFFDLRVAQNGKEIYRHGAGCTDEAGKKSLSDEDLYWLFSTSKVITCTGAMRLVERGRLCLEDPVSKYLPAFGDLTVRQADGTVVPAKTPLTVAHLFTMTSGIGSDTHQSQVVQDAIALEGASTREIVDSFAKVPLFFEPGTHYRYGYSHDVLAAVVEQVSEMRFSEYIKREILDPLEMHDTGFRPNEDQKKRFAAMHRYCVADGTSVSKPTVNEFAFTPNYDSGGAGLFSCAGDYIKFVAALSNNGVANNGYRLLMPETIAKMEQNRLNDTALGDFVTGRLHGYGWGLCGRVHINPVYSLSRSPIGEFGWDGAGGCFAMVDRKNRLGIFYGMQVRACSYSYIILQPLIRSMVYKALEIE